MGEGLLAVEGACSTGPPLSGITTSSGRRAVVCSVLKERVRFGLPSGLPLEPVPT